MDRFPFVQTALDFDGARQREQFEPGERIARGAHVSHTQVGQRPEGSQGGGWMSAFHRARGGSAKVELRRRVVSVASRARSALGGNHTLLLEIPDHPRGQTHRFAGGADSWKLFRIAAVVSLWHLPVIYHTSVSFGGS